MGRGSNLQGADAILYGRRPELPARPPAESMPAWRSIETDIFNSWMIANPFYGKLAFDGKKKQYWCGGTHWAVSLNDKDDPDAAFSSVAERTSDDHLIANRPNAGLHTLLHAGDLPQSRHALRSCEITEGTMVDPRLPMVEIVSVVPGADKEERRYQTPVSALQAIENIHGGPLIWLCYHGPDQGRPARKFAGSPEGNHGLMAYDKATDLIGVIWTTRIMDA